MSLFKGFAIFSFLTFISRIFGFIRDLLIAYKLGATALADVFFVAFRLPNLFRALFAEGAFSSAFIPMYSKSRDKKFVDKMFSLLFVTLCVFCVAMQFVMPYFVFLIAPGFVHDPVKFDMVVVLSRIMFPYLIMISLVSLLGGLLQAHKNFWAISGAPIILNICMIIGLVYLDQYIYILYALAFSVLIAGLLQLLLLLSSAASSGYVVRFGSLTIDDNMKEFFRKLFPVVFGAGIIQISTIVDTFFASSIPGAVSYLYYADRVTQLPLALIGISLGNVLLPLLSEYAASSDFSNFVKVQNHAIRLGLTFSIPSAVALYTFPDIVIRCLFGYGAFSDSAVLDTANAAKAFATALPAFVLYKIVINNYFARGDTRTPVVVSAICLFVNVCLNIILMRYYAHVGIVIATSVANWLNVIILTIKLRMGKCFEFDVKLDVTCVKIVFASGAMLLVTQMVDLLLHPLVFGSMPLKLFVITSMAVTGMLVYFGVLYLLNKIQCLRS